MAVASLCSVYFRYMQPLAARGCSAEQIQIWADVLAQAVTGELIGALNYTTLAELYQEPSEKREALEHAQGERGHAASFTAAGKTLGIDVMVNLEAQYWRRIRSSFLSRAKAGDLVGCILAQEVMLESFAVASYGQVAEAAPGELGSTFARIAEEEGEHVDHAIKMLRAERARDPHRFDTTVHETHEEIMTTLAQMISPKNQDCGCSLCAGSCVKSSLSQVGVRLSDIRGASLHRYLRSLDEIGVPGESSLIWVAQLPV
jgi:fatty aldehyde decarbonylase